MEKPRLLFVDDEPSIRTLLSAILKQRGFEVTAAATVSEALSLIASQSFDVLISDLNIGEAGDGFTVVSAMRRTQPSAATFILTGYPAFESALEAIRQQVDDYFVKPANVDELIAKILARLAAPEPARRRIEPRRLGSILEEHKPEIFSRWLAAAKSDGQMQSTTLSDEALADHLPFLIEEIIASPDHQKLSARALQAAQRHGATRFQQGCGIPTMVREARILHEVISRTVHENLLAVDISFLITDIMAIGETIQAFLEESVRSFLNARHTHAESASPAKGVSVLLLSADRELSLLRYHSLQHGGFTVARADSLQDAVALLRSRYDALVISYSLSTDSIAQFTSLFRETSPGAPIVCVVKGKWHDLKIPVDFTVNGDDGPEALLETLDAAINRKSLRRIK